MVVNNDRKRLKKLLVDAIRMLCKNGLAIESDFHIEATIGITLSESDIVLISFKERVCPDGSVVSHMLADDELVKKSATTAANVVYCVDDSNDDCLPCPQSPSSVNNTQIPNEHQGFQTHKSDQVCYDVQPHVYKSPPGNAGTGSQATCSRGSVETKDILSTASVADGTYFSATLSSMSGFDTSAEAFDSNCQAFSNNSSDSGGDIGSSIKNEMRCDGDVSCVKTEQTEQADELGTEWPLDQITYTADHTNQYMSQSDSNADTNRMSATRKPSFRMLRGGNRWKKTFSSSANAAHSNVRPPASVCVPHSNETASVSTYADTTNVNSSQHPFRQKHRFTCNLCGSWLGSIQTLRTHVKKKHMGLKTERCRLCGEMFRWASQVERHKRLCHSDDAMHHSSEFAVDPLLISSSHSGGYDWGFPPS